MTYWEAVIQNAIGCTLGSFLAISVSYIIYYRSIKKSREDQELEKSRNDREAYELFVLLVQNVCRSSETMICNIHEFTNDLLKSGEDFPELKYIPLNDFKRVSELQDLQKFLFSFSKLYKSKETAVKDFANIFAKVDYLQAQFNALPQQAEKGQHFHHQRQLQLKGLIEQSDDTLKNILLPLAPTDPLVTIFRPIINQYGQQRQPKSPLSIHIQYLVKPVYDAIVSLQKQNTLSNDLLDVKNTTGQALGIFDQMPEHNKVLSIDISKTLESVEGAFNALKTLADKMTS